MEGLKRKENGLIINFTCVMIFLISFIFDPFPPAHFSREFIPSRKKEVVISNSKPVGLWRPPLEPT